MKYRNTVMKRPYLIKWLKLSKWKLRKPEKIERKYEITSFNKIPIIIIKNSSKNSNEMFGIFKDMKKEQNSLDATKYF